MLWQHQGNFPIDKDVELCSRMAVQDTAGLSGLILHMADAGREAKAGRCSASTLFARLAHPSTACFALETFGGRENAQLIMALAMTQQPLHRDFYFPNCQTLADLEASGYVLVYPHNNSPRGLVQLYLPILYLKLLNSLLAASIGHTYFSNQALALDPVVWTVPNRLVFARDFFCSRLESVALVVQARKTSAILHSAPGHASQYRVAVACQGSQPLALLFPTVRGRFALLSSRVTLDPRQPLRRHLVARDADLLYPAIADVPGLVLVAEHCHPQSLVHGRLLLPDVPEAEGGPLLIVWHFAFAGKRALLNGAAVQRRIKNWYNKVMRAVGTISGQARIVALYMTSHSLVDGANTGQCEAVIQDLLQNHTQLLLMVHEDYFAFFPATLLHRLI